MSEPGLSTNSQDTRRATRHLLSAELIRWVLLAAVVVIAVTVLGVEIEQHINAIESWVESLGAWSLLAYVALYVLLTTMLVPESILAVMAGAIFGVLWGGLVVVVAAFLAAALQFALSRRSLREPIQRTLGTRPSLAIVQQAVLSSELRLQLLIRLMPVNPATVSYVLGAAGVRFRTYMMACVAFVPHMLLEVWAGYAAKHVTQLASASSRSADIEDLAMIGGLIAAIVALVVIARTARAAFIKAATQR